MYTISIVLLVFSVQSCVFKGINLKRVKGNGIITEKEVQIANYNEIDFGGSANIVYEQKTDAEPYFRIEIDENIYPLLTINSNNGVLTIEHKENISPTRYNIITNSSGLKKVQISGSSKIHLKGKLEEQEVHFRVSGSGHVTGDEIISKSITTRVSGSGGITLNGETEKMDNNVSGSGNVNAINMHAENVTCTISGSGNISIYADKSLNGKVSGSGNINYKGNPQISKSVSGSGRIIKAD